MIREIYLASASPRRRELLGQIGIDYRTLQVEVPEVMALEESPEMFALRLALAKARAGRGKLAPQDPRPVLGADTVVVAEGVVLGKPAHRAEAARMLSRLSGRSHQVITAVALVGAELEATRLSVSTVTFRRLTPEEIDAYWQSGEPADKAGAYAIQGKGALFVERLEGSYSGVMGLPLFETGELLHCFGILPLGC